MPHQTRDETPIDRAERIIKEPWYFGLQGRQPAEQTATIDIEGRRYAASPETVQKIESYYTNAVETQRVHPPGDWQYDAAWTNYYENGVDASREYGQLRDIGAAPDRHLRVNGQIVNAVVERLAERGAEPEY